MRFPFLHEYPAEAMKEILVKGDVRNFINDIKDKIEINLETTTIYKIFKEKECNEILSYKYFIFGITR